MRSRYTAYSLERRDYILQSWHSSQRPAQLQLDSQIQWLGLQIINSGALDKPRTASVSGADAWGWVEFIADFSCNGQPGRLHERSRFVRQGEDWFYLDGEQLESPLREPAQRPGRNDPCFCGSGKKYKKCCKITAYVSSRKI